MCYMEADTKLHCSYCNSPMLQLTLHELHVCLASHSHGGVFVAPACPPLSRAHTATNIFFYASSTWLASLFEFHCKNKILKYSSEFCIIKTRPSFPLHFPQKKAKKLEGETIYIRHSNLMLEVCIKMRSPF